MNKREIEASLCRAVNQAPALDFEKLAAMAVIPMSEDDYITRPAQTAARALKSPRYYRQLSAAVAGCMVMLACITTWFVQFKSPDSIIALDANQSVEIITNRQKQIISVKVYNKEAQRLLDQQDFSQTDLKKSVDVIVSAMISNGYLDQNRSIIMVSVENENAETASDLAASLDQVIKESASNQDVSPTVLQQSVITDAESKALAEQYNVSTGKVKIMKEIAQADESLSMESLAAMSVADLIQVSEEKSIDLTKIIKSDDKENLTDQKKNDAPTSEIKEDPVIQPPDGSQTEATAENPVEPKTKDVKDPDTTDATKATEDNPPVKDQSKPEEVQPEDDKSIDKPNGSETITPPDSSETIVLPDGEEDDESGLEAPADNESELIIPPPQNTVTETPDQEAPVPITTI